MTMQQAGRLAPAASDRDEILHGMLLAASEFLLEPQVFTVAGEELRGYLTLEPERAEGKGRLRRLPLKSLSVLCRCVSDRIPYLGPVPETDPCALLCEPDLLGRRGLVAAPLVLGNRTACLLVGHPRRLDRSLRQSVIEVVQEAAIELGKVISLAHDAAAASPKQEPSESPGEVFLLEPQTIKRARPEPASPNPPPASPAPPAVVEPPAVVARPAVVEPPAVVARPVVVEPPAVVARPVVVERPAVVARPVVERPAVAERRRYSRFPVQIEVTHSSEHNFFTGFMEDLSEGGLFIATFHLYEIGHRFELEFTVPGHERPIVVACKVRWVRCYHPNAECFPGMGVEFLDLHDAARTAIQAFIGQRQPIFYD